MKKIINYFRILFSVILLDVFMLILAIFWPSQVSLTIRRLNRELTKKESKKKK